MVIFALYECYPDNFWEERYTIINLYLNQDDAMMAKLELVNTCRYNHLSYSVKEMNVL
jgi:hypothetical protein